MRIGILFGYATLVVLLAICCANPAFALDVEGNRFEDTTIVAGQQLRLNGAGMRAKLVIKLYAAALYLQEKRSQPADILAEAGAKRVVMVMQRDFSSDTFAQAFIDGIKKNSDLNERSRFVIHMLTFGRNFGTVRELQRGDALTTDWVPGVGTVISINGKKLGEAIPDEGFYRALLKIWLGPNPVDTELKKAMLGGI